MLLAVDLAGRALETLLEMVVISSAALLQTHLPLTHPLEVALGVALGVASEVAAAAVPANL